MAFLSSKAKRQAAHEDISRLLEPEYAPTPRRSYQLTLIRDENGDFHDPDYRPFSPLPRPKSPPRRQQPSPRPYWETVLPQTQVYDDEDSDDEEEEVLERRLSDGYAFSPNYAQRRSAQFRREQYRYSSYSPSYVPSYTYPSPSTTEYSSPPTSYDSEVTVLDEKCGEKEKHGWACALRNRLVNGGSVKDVEIRSEKQKEKKSLGKVDDVPTCGEVLKRRWVILRLSMQFSMFRAQRRMKRVQSLMTTIH